MSTNRKKNRILELGCGQVKAPGAVGVDSNFDATAADVIWRVGPFSSLRRRRSRLIISATSTPSASKNARCSPTPVSSSAIAITQEPSASSPPAVGAFGSIGMLGGRLSGRPAGLWPSLVARSRRSGPALRNANGNPAKWVHAYAGEDGWFRVDSLQRRLETWVAKMAEEPETEKGLAVVRREHEELLKKMADGFARLLGEAAWTIPGALHQTRIHPDVVQAMGGRVAYFFVDAMRFEMGVDLARQLEGTKDLTIRPAIAALPTITPVGMAALLPGASASFSVVEQKGKLAASIEGTTMSGLAARRTFLKAKVPDAMDIPLGKLLGTSPSQLRKSIGAASLVIVRSQEIDALGENVDELTARAAMEGVIGNVARAIRKLASAGIEHFVVTADHGHQFSIRKHDDMKTDNPGGNTVDIHRRCWIGHGGTTPPGTVRVSGAALGYDTNLDFVFPTGLGV